MLKSLLFIIASVFLITTVKGQSRDTAIYYYKYDLQGSHEVSGINFADYFRMILPPDSGDNLKNIKEYYKNGKIKLVGKFDPQLNLGLLPNSIRFSGDYISFYSNGKKQSVAHYTSGNKDGNEYLFYPNGSVYCCIKHVIEHGTFNTFTDWECYDSDGTMICKDGNGQWILYDKTFKNILASGPIKNGFKEGEWHGRTGDADSIKYLYTYHKGVIVSSIGYDETGYAYPFKREAEMASYKGGPITFIEVFKSHLSLPRGPDGKKMLADTVHISFTIEKDGRITDFKALGNVNLDLENALSVALIKCRDWTPSTYYGIPLRTEVVIPLDFTHEYIGNRSEFYQKEVNFKFRILGD